MMRIMLLPAAAAPCLGQGSETRRIIFYENFITGPASQSNIFSQPFVKGNAKITLSGVSSLQNQQTKLHAKHQSFIFVNFKTNAWRKLARQRQDVENHPM
jgi:hypothetical protein